MPHPLSPGLETATFQPEISALSADTPLVMETSMVAEVSALTVLPLTTDSMERKSVVGTELLSSL